MNSKTNQINLGVAYFIKNGKATKYKIKLKKTNFMKNFSLINNGTYFESDIKQGYSVF